MSDDQESARAAREAQAARDVLAAVRSTRAGIAERAATPWWYPPSYGLGVGGIVASLALPIRVAPFAVFGCALYLGAVYAVWRRVSGLSVSGLRPGKTRRIAMGIGLTIAVFCALAIRFRDVYPDGRVPIVGGVILAILAARASIAWDRAWRDQIREELS